MGLLVVSCLALFVVSYLITMAAQAIKIERALTDITRFVEDRIARIYQEE